ncbi:hypothetical protein [Calothrix sp. NIES-2098]|uniref:hypothetical protein n=1 Tax=Calothrix sp. NIES-2098 TaxID=1954171 RepID=UPI000B60DEF8|nr:hypothetical protein NIES2098_34290 [Calothrix sp. NIES-2098]
MNSSQQQNLKLLPIPKTFAEAVARVKQFILSEYEREIAQKQLYYHNIDHVMAVKQRASLIFQTISPYLPADVESITRMELLLDLCAIAHDTIQIFTPNPPRTSRRREASVSENATIEKLLDFIQNLNQQISASDPKSTAIFTNADLSIIQEAISATICLYDPTDQSIYQPSLYENNQNISYIARIIALADINGLGMEGIAAYNQEGSLLFLEENPDIIPLIQNHQLETLATDNPELYENLRQRLLRRAQFQVNFAKSRLYRVKHELLGFPEVAILTLRKKIFKYLNIQNIREIAATTPTDPETALEVFIKFFEFERLLSTMRIIP